MSVASRSPSSGELPLILTVDDDPIIRRTLERELQTGGYRTQGAADAEEALAALSEDVNAVLLDLFLPGASGLECLRGIREKFPELPVIMISGAGQVQDAVQAMKEGASDYLNKPVSRDELLTRVKAQLNAAELRRDNRHLKQMIGPPVATLNFIGQTAQTRALLERAQKVAQLDSTVLITGPSGTGKTTLAQMIHQWGPRAQQPFVAVSCAALPRDLMEAELFGHARGAFTGAVNDRPGRVEIANGGTLFLDEIGDLPLELQPKLLTFLQDRYVQRIGDNKTRKVDVRLIAATHQDLTKLCREKRFREDLYFRLNVLSLAVLPLRDRVSDLTPLAEELLQRIARRRGAVAYRLSAEARTALQTYDWPGNVRELENVLERASAFCYNAIIRPEDLDLRPLPAAEPQAPQDINAAFGQLTLEQIEKAALQHALRVTGGNKAAAARHLGICEKSIYNKLKRFGMN